MALARSSSFRPRPRRSRPVFRFHATTAFTVLLSIALAIALWGCSKPEASTRWDEASKAVASAEAAKGAATAVAPPKQAGGSFNTFFPKEANGGTRVFTQEKPGFAEARWFESGTQVATLALSDAANDAPVKSKFDTATEKLGEFPVVTVGKNQSAVLVAGKYQVKVSSPTLDHAARRALLEKFDLAGLAKL